MGSKLPQEFLYVGLVGLILVVVGKIYLLYKYCWRKVKNRISNDHTPTEDFNDNAAGVNQVSATTPNEFDNNSIEEVVTGRRGSKISNLFHLHKKADYFSNEMESSEPENKNDADIFHVHKNSAEYFSHAFIDYQVPHAPHS